MEEWNKLSISRGKSVMAKRIGFIHTVGFLVDRFREEMRLAHPETDSFHILNESLLQDLLRGKPKALVYRRVVAQVVLAAEAGADIIVVTCSSTSPAVDIARQVVQQPVLKIDDPMAEEAVRRGPRIGLLCTASSTVGPSSALIEEHAAAQKRQVTIRPSVQAAAYEALMAGDKARHDEIVRAAAHALAPTVDVVVLAQASLAHLQVELGAALSVPVLASPPLLMQTIRTSLQEPAPSV